MSSKSYLICQSFYIDLILKYAFRLQHAQFKIHLVALWQKDGEFEILNENFKKEVTEKSPKAQKGKKKGKVAAAVPEAGTNVKLCGLDN